MLKRKVLVVYTGGTFGMVLNEQGVLIPNDLKRIQQIIPELSQLPIDLDFMAFEKPLDSSDIGPQEWQQLAIVVEQNYRLYDGFVILHGTDTMSFSASMLSFLLRNIKKPVVFTGAQLPLGTVRNDARRNFIAALQVAAMYQNDEAVIQEVVICFDDKLIRANRSKKLESTRYDAFRSENYPNLATIGVHINFNKNYLWRTNGLEVFYKETNAQVGVLKLFPGITENMVRAILEVEGYQGFVMESFGAGNVMSAPWFRKVLEEQLSKGVLVMNVSQCLEGKVLHKMYQNSYHLEEIGVISGRDMTFESCLTKMVFAFSNYSKIEEVKAVLNLVIAGEFSE